jgi:type IX secretion system PorP/SprF family membrane protein
MRAKIFFFIFLSISTCSYGQIDPILNSEGNRNFWFNPASIATYNESEVSGAFRNQWANTNLQFITLNTLAGIKFAPFQANEHEVAVGFNYLYDRFGILRNTKIQIPINYQIPIRKMHLGFGISPGLQRFSAVLCEADSLVLPFVAATQSKFNLDGGLFLYHDRFSFGISATQLLNQRYEDWNFNASLTGYISAQYTQPINTNMKMEFTGIYRKVKGFSTASILANFCLYDRFRVGGGIRDTSVFIVSASARVFNFHLGYYYEKQTSLLFNNMAVSHEIRLSYELPQN